MQIIFQIKFFIKKFPFWNKLPYFSINNDVIVPLYKSNIENASKKYHFMSYKKKSTIFLPIFYYSIDCIFDKNKTKNVVQALSFINNRNGSTSISQIRFFRFFISRARWKLCNNKNISRLKRKVVHIICALPFIIRIISFNFPSFFIQRATSKHEKGEI